MDGGPGTNPGALGFYLSTWVVMMAAMMLPSITPVVLAYRDLRHQRRGRRPGANAADTGLFLAGYLAVRAAAGLLGSALLEACAPSTGASSRGVAPGAGLPPACSWQPLSINSRLG
jgi:predicted metal-binding membrane protein